MLEKMRDTLKPVANNVYRIAWHIAILGGIIAQLTDNRSSFMMFIFGLMIGFLIVRLVTRFFLYAAGALEYEEVMPPWIDDTFNIIGKIDNWLRE